MLPGGGARGAYQVGVLRAIADMHGDGHLPFPVITGTSAGAINAAMLAGYARDFRTGVDRLEHLWSNLRCHDVFRVDLRETVAKTLRWTGAMALGFLGITAPPAVLNNAPLRALLRREVDRDGIAEAIDRGVLRALAITASAYTSSRAVSFFQAHSSIEEWERPRRVGQRTAIDIEHLMASSALPLIFPACKLGHEFFGDGGMRMTSPLSTPIRLGADRLLIVGTRDEVPDPSPVDVDAPAPSIGEIGGYLLDIIFMDQLQADLTRLERVNRTLSHVPESERPKTGLRHIDHLMIKPSADLRTVAERHVHRVPRTVRFMLRRVGAWGPGMRLPSYLLFEGPFCRELMELGYHDAQQQRHDIEALLT